MQGSANVLLLVRTQDEESESLPLPLLEYDREGQIQ